MIRKHAGSDAKVLILKSGILENNILLGTATWIPACCSLSNFLRHLETPDYCALYVGLSPEVATCFNATATKVNILLGWGRMSPYLINTVVKAGLPASKSR